MISREEIKNQIGSQFSHWDRISRFLFERSIDQTIFNSHISLKKVNENYMDMHRCLLSLQDLNRIKVSDYINLKGEKFFEIEINTSITKSGMWKRTMGEVYDQVMIWYEFPKFSDIKKYSDIFKRERNIDLILDEV